MIAPPEVIEISKDSKMGNLNVLKGIRVVSFTQFLLGPAGVQFLGDLGADVIKVEPPAGAWERHWTGGEHYLNGRSVFYLSTHRNTRSIAINLKHPEGQSVARHLGETADVVIQNFRPGVAERLGVGYQDLCKLNRRLIYVSASGYGSSGPYRDLPGQDLLVQALTGLAFTTGRADGAPTAAASPVIDHHGAALLALGVLAALLHRANTGEGQHVELNMVQAGLNLQMEPIAYHLNGFPISRSKSGLATNYHSAPYGIYQTKDGYIALSVSPIQALYEATADERLTPFLNSNDAWEKRDEIYKVLAPTFARKTTSEWIPQLRAHGVWVEQVNSYDDCFAHPAVSELDPVMEVEVPSVGAVRLLKFPISFSAGETPVSRHPPEAGENTVEILKEAGYSDSEIENLRDQGTVSVK